MATCIAFFRGINVGGKAKLPMRDLVRAFEAIGLPGAVTYMQSGNVAFRCARQQQGEVARRIAGAISKNHGFEPRVVVISVQELEHAIAANPYPDAARDPKSLHLWFLSDTPLEPDLAALEAAARPGERFTLHRRVFYLHAPQGFSQSRVAPDVENRLGVAGTSRNWRTCTKTLEMAWDLA